MQLCVDYKGLNKMTIKNHFALPLISEILDRLAGFTIFTKLDLKNVYYCICIWRGNKWEMAFYMCYGHFKYIILPFGLTNALAIF